MSEPADQADDAPVGEPLKEGRPPRRFGPRKVLGKLVGVMLSLAVLLLIMAVAAWLLLHNAGMTRHILPMIPGVKVDGGEGALLGDFKARRVDIALPRGGGIVLQDVAWRRLQVLPDGGVAWQIAVKAEALKARRVDVRWVPGPASPSSGPLTDIDLPLSVQVERLQVDEAHSVHWGAQALTRIDAGVALQVRHGLFGRRHQVDLTRVVWQGWQASGQARADTSGKMAVQGRIRLQGRPGWQGGDAETASVASPTAVSVVPPSVDADLSVEGFLKALHVRGTVSMSPKSAPSATASGQTAALASTLTVDTHIQPFDAWPLASLQASLQALDLSALDAGLPQTRLSGKLSLSPSAARDLAAQLDLRNALPGAWDRGRLPMTALSGSVSLLEARAAKTLNMALHDGLLDLQVQTPSAGAAQAGSVSLKGGWGASRTLRADWRGVTPRALHGLAPPLQLSGNAVARPRWRDGLLALAQTDTDVTAEVQGLYGQAFAADAPSAKAFAPATPVPVSLNLAGRYGPGRVLIHSLRLQSQEARASVADSTVQWGGPVPWAVQLAANVQDFDPRVWLPWPATVTGAHRVSGKLSANLNARWQGQARLDVAPSVLGGLPLQGQVAWLSPANPQRMSLNADVDVAGNALRVQAELPWRRDARGDLDWAEGAQWHGRIQAPALHQLQAIAPLLGAARIGGDVQGEGSARGLWPDLRSEGRLNVSRFQWETRAGQAYRLESAQASWQLDTADLQAPTQVRVAMSKGVAGPMALDQASLEVDGTLQAHRLKLIADLTQQLRKERKPTPVHAELAGQGGLARAGREKAFTGWEGQVGQLLVRTGGLTPHVLLMAQPFRIQGNWQQDGRSVVVSPTSVNVLGAGLDVRKLQWRTASVVQDPLGDLQADVQLNPLNLATVLASWQPQAGWGGDLVLTGQLNLRHSQAQPWVVDADVRHLSGDLSLAEPTIEGNVVQRLGIRQASLTVRARDGRWRAEQQFDGRLFGLLSGQAAVTVADPRRLPSAEDALSGALNLQVRNLRPWGTWLPAGWRLSGQMQAQATLGGTVGAPQYAGKVTGQGLGIGQALLGVNITDGELEMTLEGDHLHLTRFEAKSGSQGGSLVATGDMQPAEEGMRTTLNIKADRFGLLQRVDRRVVVSGELEGHAQGEDIDILGKVKVDEGLIDISKSDAPTVGDDVYVVNRPGDDEEEEEDASSSGGPQRKVNANIEVNLGSKLKLRGRGLDAFLTGALTVTTPSNRPSLRGTIKVENGTYAAYGQKLVIERGSVAFNGPIENPRLDILAMRAQSPTAASTDVKVGVNITGTAQDPRVRLYSDPAMSETEKLSWLVLGRAPTGLGGADIGLLQTAAVALLSGEGSSPSDNLIGKLGLDELSVRQSDGAVRETVVNLGKQVSKYWYVGYERSLNATSGNWQLIYRLAQRFTVRAQAGDDNAIDFIWSWRWD